MKMLAYILNIAFVALLFITFFITNKIDGKGVLLFIALFLLPVVNVFAIMINPKEKGIVSLFLERKRLEQEQKIDAIKKSMGK